MGASQDGRRVLVLDGDLPQSLAIVRALGRRGVTVDVGAVPAAPLASHSRYTNAVFAYPDPMVDGPAFVEAVRARAEAVVYDLIIPVTEDSVHPLARQRAVIEPLAPLAIAPDDALALVANKARTFELAASLGVPIPRSETFNDLEVLRSAAAAFDYPVVAKPGRSVAAKGDDVTARLNVRYAHDAEQLIDLGKHVLPYAALIVQAYFQGDGVGVEILADHGELVFAFQHRRLHEMPLTGGGSSLRTSEPVSPELLEHSRKLIAALGWHGVAMVEFKVDNRTGACSLMEINGRFWGSLPLAIAAGADFPWLLLELYSGRRPDGVKSKDGVVCRKLSSDAWWYIEVLRRSDPEPLIQWPRRRDAVRDLMMVLSPKHHFDVQCLDDPRPGAVDLRRTITSITSRVTDMQRKRAVKGRMSRIRSDQDSLASRIASAKTIVFGCYGNINRSALAEHDLRSRLALGANVRLHSAGFHQREGRPADASMVAVAAEHGLDLSAHRSRKYTPEMVADADLIFVMEVPQVMRLAEAYPEAADKILLLGCLDPDGALEVVDPYGGTPDGYAQIFTQVRVCTAAIARALA